MSTETPSILARVRSLISYVVWTIMSMISIYPCIVEQDGDDDDEYCLAKIKSITGDINCEEYQDLEVGDDICILCEGGDCPLHGRMPRVCVYCDEDDWFPDFHMRLNITNKPCTDCPDDWMRFKRIS